MIRVFGKVRWTGNLSGHSFGIMIVLPVREYPGQQFTFSLPDDVAIKAGDTCIFEYEHDTPPLLKGYEHCTFAEKVEV